MNNRILILLPSYNRPAQLTRCLDGLNTMGSGFFDVLVLQGRATDGIISLFNSVPPALIAQYEVLGLMGDDCAMRTPGWDKLVSNALASKPGLLYGRDGIQDAKLATHPFISTAIPLALGCVLPPVFHALCADTALMKVAEAAGCLHYEPSLFTEHLHHSTGKTQADANTARTESWLDADMLALERFERELLPTYTRIAKQALFLPTT